MSNVSCQNSRSKTIMFLMGGGVFCFYECLPFMTMQSLLVNYCKFGNFAIILFSRIALKDIFATHTQTPRLNV